MKKPETMQIILLIILASGVFLLVKAIPFLRKSFLGEVVAEFPFLQKTADFSISREGMYAIWQKGPYLRKMPLDQFYPMVRERSSGKEVRLSAPLFRPNSKNLKTVKMEIFRFKASPGQYTIELAPGNSVEWLEKAITDLVPAKKADPGQYFLIIRATQPMWRTIAGIFLLVISAIMVLGGIVGSFLSF